jgi:DNA-binding NtrC family response regulator
VQVARDGLVAAAEGGTLFLDEVGELPIDLQPMLLRLLEQRTSRPVGGSREHSHDVRVVAATNRNLGAEVRARRFRQDLYYRLAAGTVRVPPLRDRREDIPLLVERFAASCGARVSREVVHALAAYHWPGNVRELRNAIERIAVLPETPVVQLLQSQDPAPLRPMPEAREEAVRRFERDYLMRVMAAAGGNVARAGQLAGVSRQYLHRLVKQHRIPRTDGGDDGDET